MKKNILFFCILILSLSVNQLILSETEVIGAKELLEKMSNSIKSNVRDYQADFKWIQGDSVQEGKLYFKNPQKLRLNFVNPPNQVICTNGYELWVYLPTHNFVLKQTLLQKDKKDISILDDEKKDDKKNKKDQKNIEDKTQINPILLNPVGFDRFLTEYAIEYNETKTMINYNGYMVYSFKLIRWRSSKSGINVVYLLVQPDGIIRKVEGITANFRKFTIELSNIKTNNGISDEQFNYQPPAHARTLDNFMSGQGELK